MSDYISVNMVSGRTNFFVLFRLRFPGATATTSLGRREEEAKATKAAQIRLKQKLQKQLPGGFVTYSPLGNTMASWQRNSDN